MSKIKVSIHRCDSDCFEKIKKACKNLNGTATWNDSGKGNRYGYVTCQFSNTGNLGKFVAWLTENGWNTEAIPIY